MIVFDVDGTLIGGEAADWASFEAAFLEIAGFTLVTQGMQEITARAIVHEALGTMSVPEKERLERAICERQLQGLIAADASHPIFSEI